MEKKSIDFVYSGGDCPSDGCSEYHFNNKSSFNNDFAIKAFVRARETIDRYALSDWRTNIPRDSPLRTKEEICDFVAKIKELVPNCDDVLTIFSCKHGRILYQKAIRFKDVEDVEGLIGKIKTALPIDLEKEKRRPISSYFQKVD